jgi:hypothetical protein
MPAGWTDKDERQYEHIKDSEQDRGVGLSRAKEIAARTVNKERSAEGRTKTAKKSSASKSAAKKSSGRKSTAKKSSGRKSAARKRS